MNTIHIKGMVCPRCIETVRQIFEDLNVAIISIQLGEVIINEELSVEQKNTLGKQLSLKGFELLQDVKSALIGKIKSLIIQQIHHSQEPLTMNFSTFLAETLLHDYSHLSRLFSSVEGLTIERFVTLQKIEKVKELLFYNQLNLSQIAIQMHYSSTAHLSSQFKKETGMTPSAFKKQHKPGHQSLDAL